VQFDLAGPGGAALIVPVQVNGAGPFPFVLDTGATLTCVDETLVTELALPDANGPVAIGGGVRGLGRMRLVTLESVALGEATVRDLQGCAIDLAPVRKVGIDVRGLLGLNFLKPYRLTVDFPGRVVRLERPVNASGG
jgi:predicted aspartyl protease